MNLYPRCCNSYVLVVLCNRRYFVISLFRHSSSWFFPHKVSTNWWNFVKSVFVRLLLFIISQSTLSLLYCSIRDGNYLLYKLRPSHNPGFWAAALEGTMSCRTECDFSTIGFVGQGLKPWGWDLSLEVRIWALRLGFEPWGWDLSLEAGIWASRLGFEPRGWDLGFKVRICISGVEHEPHS